MTSFCHFSTLADALRRTHQVLHSSVDSLAIHPGLTLEREAPFDFIAKVSLKQAKQTKQSNHTQF